MADHLLQPGFALNEEGFPTTPGYAFTPVLTDAPLRARTSPLRYKEWDFYQITNPRYTLQVTLGHVSYAGAIDVVLFDYNGLRRRLTLPMILPFRKLGLAPKADAEGTVSYRDDRYAISVTTEPCRRVIEADILHSRYGACRLRLQLDYRPDDQGILVLTPFRQPRCFYHNYKQNCMTVSGFLALGDGFRADFDPSDSFAVLDWGRGVLPFRHRWWWSNGSCRLPDGSLFGFNFGVFGDNSFATENALFYQGKAIKLGNVTYTRGACFDQPFRFRDDADRIDLTMTPFFDNHTSIKALVVSNECHQVFGRFDGFVTLDDGKRLNVCDMIGFCEEARNQW